VTGQQPTGSDPGSPSEQQSRTDDGKAAQPQLKPSEQVDAAAEPALATVTPGRHVALSGRVAYPLALLSGLLYFLAFPGIDLYPLGLVALVPLFVALRGQTRRRATALGWLAGFTMTMLGFYWLLGMLEEFSGFPTALCALLMAILCAYQAGRVALCGLLHACIEQRDWPAALAFCLAFVASELLFPLLFPWTYAATVHQLPALMQSAELGGPSAVVLVLLAANLALAEPIVARLERRAVRWRPVALLAAVPVLAAVYGAVRIAQVDRAVAQAPKAQVGIVQANMGLMHKRERAGEGLRRHLALTRQLLGQGELDLVVWSETSVVGAVPEARAQQLLERRITRQLGTAAIFGSVLLRPVSDARRYVLFNSALLSDARGRICDECRYDKQYLLMFGEYLPFGETFPSLYEISRNSGRFTPGKSLRPLRLGDRGIAVFICYEDIIPSFVNSIVRSGDTDLLVNMTNDAWFGDSTEPWIHLALAKFRTIEHRRYLIRSTNSGVSAFVDPVGRLLSHTSTFERAAISEEIAWLRPTTVFGVIGNAPWWLVSAAAVAMALFRRKPRSRKQKAVRSS
jgi:apolipoprotein N-acyltransferase